MADLSQLPETAVVEAGPLGSTFVIAGLQVIDRLVVVLHRAGLTRIILVGTAPPSLPRAAELGIAVEHAATWPVCPGPVMAVAGEVLVSEADIRRVREAGGRLVTEGGTPLPLGVVMEFSEEWRATLAGLPEVMAQGPAACVLDAASARQAARVYWASLTSSSDGWVDRHFNRPVGRYLSRWLVRTPLTPNQVSVLATLAGLVSAGLFAVGTAGAALAGALVLQLSAVVDCVDGDLARALFKQSALGKWLDIVGDQVVHVGVFLGLGVGLWRSGSTAPVLGLGLAAAAGVVVSFAVILRVLRQPALRGQSRVQRLIDAATNRDFSVLLILFALGGVLEWFLWLAAVGSHVFWILALALQLQERGNLQRHGSTA
jgi:phosphatidylglycerophosphate synthase